jgi:hypothetical protein
MSAGARHALITIVARRFADMCRASQPRWTPRKTSNSARTGNHTGVANGQAARTAEAPRRDAGAPSQRVTRGLRTG